MANSLISMIKGNSTLINNTEVLNGQVLFNTDEKSILLDDNNTRSEYCGADKSNKNLASIENGTTASKGYSVGSYVVWKGQLYRVTRQINSGTAFNVGYNITTDTVGAELTQIKSDLGNKSSASSVTGNDAFTKINTLNSDLADVSDRNNIRATYFYLHVSTDQYGTAEIDFTPLVSEPFTRMIGVFFNYEAGMALSPYAPVAVLKSTTATAKVQVLGLPKNNSLILSGYGIFM